VNESVPAVRSAAVGLSSFTKYISSDGEGATERVPIGFVAYDL
jgi:hypothetical protein